MATDNPTVGTIICRHHEDDEVIARVKLSVKKNRFYVHCPKCGLIQPTLPEYQRYIKKHARFDEEYKMYGEPREGYQGGNPDNNPEKIKEKEKARETLPPQKPAEEKPKKVSSLLGGFLNALGTEE